MFKGTRVLVALGARQGCAVSAAAPARLQRHLLPSARASCAPYQAPGPRVLLGLSWPRGRAVPQLLLLVFGGAGATVSSQGVGYSISLLGRGLKLPQQLADGVKKQRPALAVGTQLSSSSSSSSLLVALTLQPGELSCAELPQLRGGLPGPLPAPSDSPWCVTSPSSACHPSL